MRLLKMGGSLSESPSLMVNPARLAISRPVKLLLLITLTSSLHVVKGKVLRQFLGAKFVDRLYCINEEHL